MYAPHWIGVLGKDLVHLRTPKYNYSGLPHLKGGGNRGFLVLPGVTGETRKEPSVSVLDVFLSFRGPSVSSLSL